MAQLLPTDFPIDPSTTSGSELADILNRFEQATNTNNSGATAPADTYPGMPWLDTSGGGNGVLKFRDAANAAWVTIFNSAVPPVSSAGGTFTGNVIVAPAAGTSILDLKAIAGQTATVRLAGNASVPGVGSFDIQSDGTNRGYVWNWANQPIIFGTGNIERFRIEATGFVATSGASAYGSLQSAAGGVAHFRLAGNGASPGVGSFDLMQDASSQGLLWNRAAAPIILATGGNERMRVFANGNVNIGSPTDGAFKFMVWTGGTDGVAHFVDTSNAGTPKPMVRMTMINRAPRNSDIGFLFYDLTGSVLQMLYNGGIANYQANNINFSDRRLKENIAPAGEWLDKLLAIEVHTFNFTQQDRTCVGVIAQEVQAVAPELVSEQGADITLPSEVEGEPGETITTLSVYQTDLQYALLKALQELNARLVGVADRVTALEV